MAETEDAAARIEAVIDLPDDELAEELPPLLDDIEGRTQELAMENPALFGQVVQRMGSMDVSDFANDHPETVERFQTVLWTGMDLLVQFSPDVQKSITSDVTMNFDADDAPMTGSIALDSDEGTIEGSSDLRDDPDIVVTGDANTLVSLITGGTDPIQGFMQQEFQMDGDISKGVELGQTMDKLTAKLPN